MGIVRKARLAPPNTRYPNCANAATTRMNMNATLAMLVRQLKYVDHMIVVGLLMLTYFSSCHSAPAALATTTSTTTTNNTEGEGTWIYKGKGKGLDTCYSATYMSQTRDQQRFTISEVAADWHEPMVCRSALCGHPLPALTDNWTNGAACRHTIAPVSHTRPIHPVPVATTHYPAG